MCVKPGERSQGEEIRLCAQGEMLDQSIHEFFVENEMTLEGYFYLEYSCQGIRRQLLKRAPFIFARTKEGDVPLVCYDDIVMDHNVHSVAVRTPMGKCSGILVKFAADRRGKAEFVIRKMFSCSPSCLPMALKRLETKQAGEYETVALDRLYNGRYEQDHPECMVDGGAFFPAGRIALCGIPFQIGGGENNVVAPGPAPAENDDIIMNFGVPARRRLCRSVSRDSLTEIELHRPAKEIFFLLALKGVRYQRWGFATDGTILGAPDGEVTMPLTVTDTEGFMVEIQYENGNRDTALPLNLASGRHTVQGDMGIYAVAADGQTVDKVIIHNRLLDSEFQLVAMTVNTGDERLFPQMLIPKKPEVIRRQKTERKTLALSGGRLRAENGAAAMTLEVKDGLKLVEMENVYTPRCSAAEGLLLQMVDEQGHLSGDYTFTDIKLQEDCAEIVYRFRDLLELAVTVSVSEEDAILFSLKAKNISGNKVKTGIRFPAFRGLMFDGSDDGWYFCPKYQNINSNETVFVYEESAPSFPMQFMDVYSPSQQGGYSLTTRERELTVRKYGLEKDETGISFFVEYPFMYGEIEADAVWEGTQTVLTAHSGDWHASFDIYKKWLDSWYEPYRCQDKQWYRECFWLLAEITDFFETTEFTKFPVWYDEEKKEFQFERILEEQKELSGCYPDILHLWSWTNRPGMRFGNFGGTDYDVYGGMENFRDAMHEVMEKKGVHMSLYLHPTLLSSGYPQAQKFYPKHRVINAQGNFINCGKYAFRICHANSEWRDYAVSMYPRIYKELGIPLLYVDEFSLRVENRCYAEGHGHSVPSNLLKTDRDFITQLKDAMPDEVVLYGEYAAVDVNARYIDCNISYHIIDSVADMIETAWRGRDGDDRLGPVQTDMYRFAFPKIVQLVLPMAMRNLSWHPQKFIFFNGEAIYDSFWDLEESSGHAFTVKAYGLKKKYADCFSSDHPSSMVDTETPAVCANCFPGKGRCVYTLYNRAYSTYRGPILRIPHEPGTVYYDAWNDRMADVRILDGWAEISLTIDAQQIGCLEVRKG